MDRLAGWKRTAQDWHEYDSSVFQNLLNEIVIREVAAVRSLFYWASTHTIVQANGMSRPSYALSLLEGPTSSNLSGREKAWLAGTMLCVPFYSSIRSTLLISVSLSYKAPQGLIRRLPFWHGGFSR